MIIDCFTFYNEIDLLDYRIKILSGVVDYFIVVEANQTHVGKPKDLYFPKENYSNVIYIIVDLPYTNPDTTKDEQWINEKYQRNSIQLGLNKLQLNPDDIIIISDLDEIPDPRTLSELKNFPMNQIYSLEQDLYYYNLTSLVVEKWYYPKILPFKHYTKTPDEIRYCDSNFIKRGGWHLSYFGSIEFIANKIKNFVHQEFNDPQFTDTEKILARIQNYRDIYDREENKMKCTPLNINDYLPYRWDLLVKPENPLKEYYLNRCGTKSDINEHLPTLFKYSLECERIFETGVRGVVSTYAFAYGLQQNNSTKKELIVNDIVNCDISELSGLCQGINITSYWCNNLHLIFNKPVDLTFIDTWHVYGQLKRELHLFAKNTKKYIILHDTTIDSDYGESIRLGNDIIAESNKTGIPIEEICRGLQPAIDEFLNENPDWVLHERFENNNGLTVLRKLIQFFPNRK